MKLWRINLKPGSQRPGQDVTEFCVERQIVGIGWKVETVPTSKVDYLHQGKLSYGGTGKRSWSAATNTFLNRMSIGDLIWTRNRNAVYYLGKIDSDWRYDNRPEQVEAGILNLRSCLWVRVGTMDNVPGAVINAFRPAATVQRVSDFHSLEYSKFLYAQLRGESHTFQEKADIFSLLSDADLEDVVAVFFTSHEAMYHAPQHMQD